MPIEAGKIRNVAVVGHRGTGKTSLVEALLFQAGKTNRLGSIEAGSTVSDWEEDEQRRQGDHNSNHHFWRPRLGSHDWKPRRSVAPLRLTRILPRPLCNWRAPIQTLAMKGQSRSGSAAI